MGKVLILLTVLVALANARCFSQCLVQPCGEQGAASCHTHGKSSAANCAHHHDLTAPSSPAAVPMDDASFEIAAAPMVIPVIQSWRDVDGADPSPPPRLDSSSPLPLRV